MSTQENSPKFRAAELAVIIGRAFPEITAFRVAKFVNEAQRITAGAKRHAEKMCSYADYYNRNSDPETGEDKGERRLANRAAKALQILGDNAKGRIHFSLAGDPRGAVGFLHIEGLDGDGWGRDGFPIY